MIKFRKLAPFVLLFALTGCGEPTIDSSSQETMKSSMAEMMESLPEEKQQALQASLAQLFLKVGFTAMQNGASEEDINAKIAESISGKTADEIIALSKPQ